MITKYKIFESDVDPWNEEDWEEPEILDLSKITMKTSLKKGDMIYTPENAYLGVITNVKMDRGSPYYVVYTGLKEINLGQWTFYTFGYKIKKKK